MAAIPVIKGCIQRRPDVNVLMTTTTLSAFEVLKNLLPNGVIYQYKPNQLRNSILHTTQPEFQSLSLSTSSYSINYLVPQVYPLLPDTLFCSLQTRPRRPRSGHRKHVLLNLLAQERDRKRPLFSFFSSPFGVLWGDACALFSCGDIPPFF
ncbi:hypothetical protein RJ640_003169 [Escallonia rubra]|uniref:3-deoxy-D-manno-octulosonic-acid transferase N-terminal domain-containing protein n=1 Tax=Escallonia rubra TaxID=112253 RepID=A0AA88UTX6_9ASTE|nr:hypothetical protein RJ640_003169 [Escallonia rubra]